MPYKKETKEQDKIVRIKVRTASRKPSTLRVCTTRYAPFCARFCPAPWFPVCTARYREKQQNTLLFWIYFITGSEIHNRIYKFDPVCVLIFLSLAVILDLLQNRIYKFDPVCVLIFLSLGCSVVMVLWLEQNNKVQGHFVEFSFTRLWRKETNMVVTRLMPCKIGLIWRHMKTLYYF